MDQKCILLHETDTDEYVAEQAALVGPVAAADANADVAADGAIIVSSNSVYGTSRTENNAAILAAGVAVDKKNSKKSATIKAYNAAAKKVDEKYPLNPDHKTAMGFKLGKIHSGKGPCEKIINGEWRQWIHDGFAELEWGTLGVEAIFYTIEECTGDITVEANWYPADKPQSASATAIVKPKTLNVPVWWRVTGNNAAGVGVAPSDAFGGKPIH